MEELVQKRTSKHRGRLLRENRECVGPSGMSTTNFPVESCANEGEVWNTTEKLQRIKLPSSGVRIIFGVILLHNCAELEQQQHEPQLHRAKSAVLS